LELVEGALGVSTTCIAIAGRIMIEMDIKRIAINEIDDAVCTLSPPHLLLRKILTSFLINLLVKIAFMIQNFIKERKV
jgi:hypothetical protein